MLQPSVPAWFEIPTRDLDRAVRFYETVLETRLLREAMGPVNMAVFPHDEKAPSGALAQGEGFIPNSQGTVVYLNLNDIRPVLDRVTKAGGQVRVPLTALPEGMGVFARVADPEGNVVGLFSAA